MHTTPKHPSSPAVGRHPDRPAHSLVQARQNEEPSEQLSGGFSSVFRIGLLSMAAVSGTGLILVTVAALALSKAPDPTALLPFVAPCLTGLCSLIGGIIGKIVSIKEETLVLETSHDRTRIRILKTAVSRVDVKAEDAQD